MYLTNLYGGTCSYSNFIYRYCRLTLHTNACTSQRTPSPHNQSGSNVGHITKAKEYVTPSSWRIGKNELQEFWVFFTFWLAVLSPKEFNLPPWELNNPHNEGLDVSVSGKNFSLAALKWLGNRLQHNIFKPDSRSGKFLLQKGVNGTCV